MNYTYEELTERLYELERRAEEVEDPTGWGYDRLCSIREEIAWVLMELSFIEEEDL